MNETQREAAPREGLVWPTVYVFGGGIAGLTAAHELVTRGFKNVVVYERERALGIQGMVEAQGALGGLARTQYFALSEEQKPPLYYHVRDSREARSENPLAPALGREELLIPKDIQGLPGVSWDGPRILSFLGTARGQGPQAHEYFPELWLEYEQPKENEGGGKAPRELTEESKRVLKGSVETVHALLERGFFHTEQGKPHDVKIYVQAFSDPGQDKQDAVASGLGMRIANSDGAQAANELAQDALERLREQLAEPLRSWVELYPRKRGGFLRAASSLGLAPVARNWVRVIVYRPQLPGEHGYRFFPSFYRHVFDTMQRIPLHDASGQPVGGCVLSNLVSLPQIGIFSTSHAPFILGWEPPRAGEVLARADYGLRNMRHLRISSRDLMQFSLRVLRYMTSCSRRRAAEQEDVSWWDYLEGLDKRSGARLYHYGEEFKFLVQSSSRVLAALDGAHGDARTCGNTYVQLLTEALVPTSRNNCTLNGPTSESWFFHWREHLTRLGVEFQLGELETLELKEGRLAARVVVPESKGGAQWLGEDDAPVYFVVATDVLSAAEVTKGLKLGVAEALENYVSQVPEQEGSSRLVPRNPQEKAGRNKWDRLQTISGIQYFFKGDVNVFDGYLYCADAEWGLSAICSHLVWQEKPEGNLSTYQSILSVDIGDWNTPSKRLRKSAWDCSPQELQEEVLHQLRQALRSRGPDEVPADFVLPEPDWVHIDEGLEYDKEGGLLRNKTPYLVPIVGDWKNRPGSEPWDPAPHARPPRLWPAQPHVWQAPHGGYLVHHDRLVFAGTYLKTFTRLTTMESANESARHAVNAILDHCTVHLAKQPLRAPPSQPARSPLPSDPYEKGLFPTTPYGDYCRIWDPERNELPDFELLQRMDEESFLQGRPHPWDTLGVELLPSLLTKVPGAGDGLGMLMSVVNTWGAKVAPGATHGVLAVLRHFQTLLARFRPPQSS